MDKPPEALGPEVEGAAPAHGFQGDRGSITTRPGPVGLSVAVSREAGARGGSIARRAARKLGWQVYDQELLEYMAQDTAMSLGLVEALPQPAREWCEGRLEEVVRAHDLRPHPSLVNLARVVLALGTQGEVVFIGRGAGCVLPPATTLNVRVVAPLPERVAYMGQWLRLTVGEAADRVRGRDQRRAEFVVGHFHRDPADVHQYDLALNSSLLGEEVCAELIAHAARARAALLAGAAGE